MREGLYGIAGQRSALAGNKALLTAVLVGSLGGLVFGYDLGALSAATESLRTYFRLAPGLFGLTISASLWGTVVGSLVAGRLADGQDRRHLIAACALLYTMAALLIALPISNLWWIAVTARFLSGVAIGGFTVACPLYLSEVAPIRQRGRVVGSFQLQVGVGVVVAFTVGAVMAPRDAAWRWMLGLGALPSAMLFLLAELLLAKRAPQLPQGTLPQAPVPRHARERLFRRRNLRVLLVATSVALFNQLSGVNVLLLYVLVILSSAGISLGLSHRYTVLISVLGLVVTLVSTSVVDRLGRKLLLYTGSAGMAVCLLLLGIAIPRHLAPACYVGLLVAYNAFFAFSQGTVIWVYLSELFPPGLRGVGQGFGASLHWIANALLILVFPRLQHASTVKIFYLFASMMALQIVVVRLWYPELKGTALGSATAAGGNGTVRLR